MKKYNLEKDVIQHLYYDKIMILEEIGHFYNCSGALIALFMEEHNMPRRVPKARNPKHSKEFIQKVSQTHHRPLWSIRINHGYIEIKVSLKYSRPHQKKNWMKRSRFIMEQHLGRKLKYNEHIHHKNGNKQDDRIDNLQLCSKSDHDRISSLNRKRDKLGRFI